MLSYQQSVDYVNATSGTVRAVVSVFEGCTACDSVCAVLDSLQIPYVKMDSQDPALVFKSGISPTTFLFKQNNVCYPRYDVYDARMFSEFLAYIDSITPIS